MEYSMKIYRGHSEPPENNTIKNCYIEKPRKPKDSDIRVHEVADNWFYDKFKVKARSQCFFCTPDIQQAKEYGRAYEISVQGSMKLIYSVLVRDFIEIDEDLQDYDDLNQIIDWLESKSYVMATSFNQLPKDFNGEIMLYCEEYKIV